MRFFQNNSALLRQELRALITLAVPVAISELGWMSMAVVDTGMVGRLNAVAIGAVGLSSILYGTVVLFGFGLLLSMDPLVSQSYGAGDIADCHHTLHQGIILSVAITVPLMAITFGMPYAFAHLGIDAVIVAAAAPFIRILAWSTLPLLLYACLRRYMQAVQLVRPIMIALLTANLLNAFADWVLIYGHLGLPAMGIVGAAWSTFVARIYLMVYLAGALFFAERKSKPGLFTTHLRLNIQRLKIMLRLGIPAASQIILELGAFAAATIFAGRLAPAALAAHQIVLNCATLTYGIPLGIGSATAVSVGHALGRKDPQSAIRVGWLGIFLGAGCMSLAALTFVLFPKPLMRLFTTDTSVIAIGVTLLIIAAFFQLFDGVQTVTTGALRGLGDTKSAMLLNLLCYWLLGVPLGYALCFHWHMGAAGIWYGLSAALVLLAITVLLIWKRRLRSIATILFRPTITDVPMF